VDIWQAILLGLTQGASEYAPISSSGHLILVPWMLDIPIVRDADLNKTFDVALHMGTLLGAIVYFRRDLWRYLRAWAHTIGSRHIDTTDERLAWALVIGTIPAVIVGATLEHVIQGSLSQPWLIAVMFVAFGVVLWLVDKVMRQDRRFDTINVRTGLYLGVAQALALQPGVSRSGVTMTAARLIGLDRGSSARFSFLLSIPVVLGAGTYKSLGLLRDGFGGYGAEFFWGFVASAVSGFVVIAFLLRYLRGHSFAIFLWYRVAVAALAFGLMAAGVRPATI
jgi:undecaprenyl-diphosphatase